MPFVDTGSLDVIERLPGFPEADQKRITTCLDRLFPHLTPSKCAITGGVGIACQLALRDIEASFRSLNDIDLVAESMEVVHPEITRSFLVNHYHPPQPGYDKFMIQLADPVSKLRVDIFSYLSTHPSRMRETRLGKWTVRLVALEDQLVRKVALLQDLSASNPEEPKHYDDVALLETMADIQLAGSIWDATMLGKYPYSFTDAIRKLYRSREEHPEWVRREFYLKVRHPCAKCRHSPLYPIAAAEDVVAILGWA
jgi:hypothetical protein